MKKTVVKAALYLLSKECCSYFYDNKACIYPDKKKRPASTYAEKKNTYILLSRVNASLRLS